MNFLCQLFLKATKHVITAPPKILFNAFFSIGIFPDLFQIAKVSPVFKKLQTSLNNYRLISVLLIFNQLLEKLMHKRIFEFLEKEKTIYWKLLGLREYHSTDHANLGIIDLMQPAIDCQEFPCSIVLDFSEASDTLLIVIS